MRLFFFGDSICFGQHVSPHLSWVHRVAKRLSEVVSQELIIANPSINGNTTRMALERMPHDVQAHAPEILLVQFGMNDCNYWETDRGMPRVSPGAFKANLEEIIERAFCFGTQQVFLNTNHPTPLTTDFNHAPTNYQSSNTRYNALIREAATATSVTLIDVEAAWHDELVGGARLEDLLLPDGVHLSPAGHLLYEKIIFPHLKLAVAQCGQ